MRGAQVLKKLGHAWETDQVDRGGDQEDAGGDHPQERSDSREHQDPLTRSHRSVSRRVRVRSMSTCASCEDRESAVSVRDSSVDATACSQDTRHQTERWEGTKTPRETTVRVAGESPLVGLVFAAATRMRPREVLEYLHTCALT